MRILMIRVRPKLRIARLIRIRRIRIPCALSVIPALRSVRFAAAAGVVLLIIIAGILPVIPYRRGRLLLGRRVENNRHGRRRLISLHRRGSGRRGLIGRRSVIALRRVINRSRRLRIVLYIRGRRLIALRGHGRRRLISLYRGGRRSLIGRRRVITLRGVIDRGRRLDAVLRVYAGRRAVSVLRRSCRRRGLVWRRRAINRRRRTRKVLLLSAIRAEISDFDEITASSAS